MVAGVAGGQPERRPGPLVWLRGIIETRGYIRSKRARAAGFEHVAADLAFENQDASLRVAKLAIEIVALAEEEEKNLNYLRDEVAERVVQADLSYPMPVKRNIRVLDVNAILTAARQSAEGGNDEGLDIPPLRMP
jgi:hypothetical protein